ncbi:MAG: ATP-binding cassette domain-containing protein, partial [Actinomycetota bacterium]
NWTLGGALAGLAGIMLVPGGLSIVAVLLITVPAFAAAVLGGFRSYLITTLGAVAIAMAQSIFTFQSVREGWPAGIAPATPFLVVAIVLFVRSDALPTRDEIVARLPRVATTPPRWLGLAAASVAVAIALTASTDLANALITSAAAAIIGLSLVVVTGLSGQISLGQYALAGLGALAAARTSEQLGWPFLLCLAVGVAAAAAGGAVFALPALRTRGPVLAVVTIGLGLAVQQGILADIDITGGASGNTPIERPTLAGVDVNAIDHPGRYAAMTVAAFSALAFMIANLRRTRVGRRLLAVRNNERAASALGASVAGAKLYAFVLASAIAGVGGVLIAFRFDAVQYSQFTFFQSLQILSFALIGGIGYVIGPLIGTAAVPNGVIAWLADDIGELERWLLLGAGLVLILTLIKAPNGVVALVTASRETSWRPRTTTAAIDQREPSELAVEGLSVRYGSVVALDEVSLTVRPGQVVGLIGANGAGKTTLIDAVSGFARATGRVRLDGTDVARMSPTRRAALGIGRCFQTIELFEDLTVRDNLLAATDRIRPRHWVTDLVAPSTDDIDARTREIVDDLDLTDQLERLPDALSHGQRRLVGVARALAAGPGVLLLDEPAAGLDRKETEGLGRTIRDLADSGMGILLVEHDVELVVKVSDHVVALDFGRVVYEGTPSGVSDDPAVRRAYLGTLDDDLGADR